MIRAEIVVTICIIGAKECVILFQKNATFTKITEIDITESLSLCWCILEYIQHGAGVVSGREEIPNVQVRELKWTGMGEFNLDDHYIYHCGQESIRKNGVAIIVNKRVWNAVLRYNLKNDRMISVCFQGKPFNIMVIQVYTLTTNAEEAEVEQFYEDP